MNRVIQIAVAAVAESAARANEALDKALEAIGRREAEASERHAAIVTATRREFKPDEAAALGALLGFTTSETAT
jgi:hypothetical protein